MRGADVVDNRARILIVKQPLIQALQGELTRTVTRGAVLAGVGVHIFLCHGFYLFKVRRLRAQSFVVAWAELFERTEQIGHLDGHARRVGTLGRHARLSLLIVLRGQHRVGDRNPKIEAHA